ncbi:TRAP-type C4-dicarboxylate transport system, periplasmic component [Clostridium aceticum]|uniref:TRAP-type C4-dicarboxylate transport system, periplasmic component n=1 Tax=Clostridium aceticum TaxID=84022 RepID=A0A0D8I869_9CLOT|nr:C4-dicarboxylate TRAP transporter substrate-binding protein [Clostridium aceticum]AKL94630.1 TRAP-type C4-dicarboxylate transport system, periplasmic component [Clostridium aceticum]KJF26470.1 C4-dicarboxylate ABC transporter [Clostridium aceticum]
MRKKLLMVVSLMLVLTMLSACGTGGSQTGEGGNSDTYTLKIGMVVTEQDPMYLGAMELKRNVEERTEGRLKVEVYPSSQLGDTKDIMEQAKVGANVAAISDAALMSEIVPEIGVLAAPYVVDNYEEAEILVTSDLFKGWYENVADSGYRVLSFNWYQGDRHFMTNKLVETPEDLRGLRIRTPGSPIFIDSINAMGANATALAWGEVYPGLQQRVIDGFEAQYPAIVGARLYETSKYIAKTGHFQLMSPLVVGNGFFESLPADIQEILLEEAEKAGKYASEQTLNGLVQNEEDMKAQGVTITEVDITAFKEASESVYQKNNLQEAKAQVDALLGK